MRQYRFGPHTKRDLKVHLAWIPEYRKGVLPGEVALRVRDFLRQIAGEHELVILSRKVAKDPLSYMRKSSRMMLAAVFIDYELAPHGFSCGVGRLFGKMYARWCVERMIGDAVAHFGAATV